MPAILFVCTANQFRSPLAAAFFSRKMSSLAWKEDWLVQSAGVWASPGLPALPLANIAAHKLGVSLEGHRTQRVTSMLVSTQDLILVMEAWQKEALQQEFALFSKRVYLLTEAALNRVEDIPDPVVSDTENYIEVVTRINEMIMQGFYRICGMALKASSPRIPPATFDSASAF
jgi:protein-tyrosine-phosphatase